MLHGEIRRLLAERLAGLRRETLPVAIYPHQEETLEKIRVWLENPAGTRRGYVSHATGLGKTVLFASLLRLCHGLRALVIVSTKTLVDQTARKLSEFAVGQMAHASSLPNILSEDGDVLARRWTQEAYDVLVATDETFKRKYASIRNGFDPQVVIWDECHWAYTEQAQAALAPFDEAVTLAFSATPDFLTNVRKNDYAPVTLDNGQVLFGTPDRFARTHFGESLDERGVRWGIEHGFLAPLAWGRLEFGFSLDDVPSAEGPGGPDYDQSALAKVLAKNWPFVIETVCKLYRSGQYVLGGRFAAAICPGVKHAYEIAEALNGLGIPAACITASTADMDRARILKDCESGRIRFLASVFALREGWDSPKAEVAMMLRPTKSRVLYTQFMGRVLRKNGDKVALVLDPHYQNTRIAPLNAPVLFGVPGQAVREGDILVGPKDGKARKTAPWMGPEALAKLRPVLVIDKIDVEYWAGPDGFFDADGERWGTITALARALGLSKRAISRRIRRNSHCRHRQGVDRHGHPAVFYALADVKSACADLLSVDRPQLASDGFFDADGERWGTIRALSLVFGISEHIVHDLIVGCRHRPGRDRRGIPTTFYAFADARKACASRLQRKDLTGSGGLVTSEGEKWITVSSLAKRLGRSEEAVRVRLRNCRTLDCLGRRKRRTIAYALSDVEKACADWPKRQKSKKA